VCSNAWLGPMHARSTPGAVVAKAIEPRGLERQVLGIDAEPVVAQMTCNPGSLNFLDFLGLAEVVGQIRGITPGNNLTRSRHGDNVGAEPLREIVSQEMLVLAVQHDASARGEPTHVVAASMLLDLNSTDLLNQIAEGRSELLLLFPGEGVVPGHLAGAPGVLLWLLG
jgi:hypothetical protein